MSENNLDAEWVYGLHTVQTLLKTDAERVVEIRFLRGRQHDHRVKKLLTLAGALDIPVTPAGNEQLDQLAGEQHQGVIALCRSGQIHDERFLHALLDTLTVPPLVLVVDGVTDPHNLGACLRSANAAGVHAVLAPKDRAVGITATVRKVASGAAEVVPFVVVTNLARALRQLQDKGLWLVGMVGEAEHSIYDVDLRGPLAMIVGAEEKGLRRLTREQCDTTAKIPMAGIVESLNVSVAAGICLFEAVRQRGQ